MPITSRIHSTEQRLRRDVQGLSASTTENSRGNIQEWPLVSVLVLSTYYGLERKLSGTVPV